MAKDFYTSGLPANKQERIPFEKREEFPLLMTVLKK